MRRKPKVIHNFYKSDTWKLARQIKIKQVNGKCERCGNVGEEVHHKIRLTVDNVKDVSISINPENLELLCKQCHNKEHKRFCSQTTYYFNDEGELKTKKL